MDEKLKKIGIMQPYFLPYIGYWQLMNLVDQYVIYDDVNYINRGWINRNRIIVNGQAKFINLPLQGASQNKLICEINVHNDKKAIDKTLKMVSLAYRKAPYYEIIYPMVVEMYDFKDLNIVKIIKKSFEIVCEYLDIETEFILSSSVKKDNSLRGQNKILAICKELKASEYYNAIGGMELYDRETFEKSGIALKFLKMEKIEYPQFGDEFKDNLSILDVMMFNPKETIKDYLKRFKLIEGEAINRKEKCT